MPSVIDVHTHMLSQHWLDTIRTSGGRFGVDTVIGGQEAIFQDGQPFMTLTPPMLNYEQRVTDMDAAGVELAVVSLTCPSVYWGGEAVSSALAAAMNDDMAAAQAAHPGRIAFFATLPWEYPSAAVAELHRARAKGAIGVMVLANIGGAALTDERFAPIWTAIEASGLPVLVHPTTPPGSAEMGMAQYNLVANIGFMFDTTLAFTQMIFSGFLDRYPGLQLIASHGGGTLPYLAGRLDQCWENMPACRVDCPVPPSQMLRRLYFDAVLYEQAALDLCLHVAGPDRVLYGSDYPHNIGDMAGVLRRVDGLHPTVRDGVRFGNAQKLFRL
jgi:aminocarboxymuconate-semialdehyde decarboxylase